MNKVTVTKIVKLGVLVLTLREIYFKKSGKRSASVELFIAEQAVGFFGIACDCPQLAVLFFANCGQQKLQ